MGVQNDSNIRLKGELSHVQELPGETDSTVILGEILWKICTMIHSIFREDGGNRLL
jgi:hypothetical protein